MSTFTPPKNAHWYLPDGTPAFEIPKKRGDGMKKPNINDAIDMGLLPSVTTVLKVVDKPFLVAWMKNQVLDAALACSQAKQGTVGNGFIADEDRTTIIEMSDQASLRARNTGLGIHKDIEEFVEANTPGTGIVSYQTRVISEATLKAFASIYDGALKMARVLSEYSFASPRYGFAGRLDWGGMVTHPEHGRRFAIVDIKTQDTKGKGKFNLYPEVPCQLAAYAYGIGRPTADLYSVMISSTEEGLVEVWYHHDNDFYFYAFLECLRVWKGPLAKSFDCKGMGAAERIA